MGSSLAWGQGEPLPACRYDDLAASRTGYDAWSVTLLDTTYALGPDYVPIQSPHI